MRRGLLLVALLGATLVAGTVPSPGTEAPIADREIGLSKTSVLDIPEPDRVVLNDTEPGEGPLLGRSGGFPPRIPHIVADYLPIELGDNACVDCHEVEEKIEGEPTPIPRSHHVDLRNAPEEMSDEIVGARYYCVSCHVRVTTAPLLVDNLYAD